MLWENFVHGSIMYDEANTKIIFRGKGFLSGKVQIIIRGKLHFICNCLNECGYMDDKLIKLLEGLRMFREAFHSIKIKGSENTC